MKKSTLALAVYAGVLATQAGAAGFLDDSKATLSSRTLYFEQDPRQAASNGTKAQDQRQTTQGFLFNFISGYTPGTFGFGLDVQGMYGINLSGGIDNRQANTVNTVSPMSSDGTPDHDWARAGANAKVKISKTELKVGNALQPNLPILVSNDGRLLPQTFEGGIITSKEFDGLTLTAGKLTQAAGRASTNYADLSVQGGTKGSNNFQFAGGDYKVTKDLTVQYYYANLEDYYKQQFLGLVHVLPIAEDQSFKTDLRYFHSTSDGKNGDANNTGYKLIGNGYAGTGSDNGEVDNDLWTAMFTYTLGGHALMLGYQSSSDSGAMPIINSGNVTKNGNAFVANRNSFEGEGGNSVYLFTDSMITNFTRAGEQTKFGQYSYDFARLGVPGLKAAIAYLYGDQIRLQTGGRGSEWERDMRIDYVFQDSLLKGFGVTVRRANLRSDDDLYSLQQNIDQTRVVLNYTYAFK
ncbi:OprD family porin [Pseudomonas sp. KU26590]|uniref:OprD family outer membrane porin n=1 Tax=Pseudomonas sp. KU26590 TaxID=2991051 RepID=UPI00223E14B8|nr:OprD family outer membrane porin [Pseudomonas sp. KU26590]UZJ60243.1 OprD family porin [Pseudomonas sp. KU26590]